MATTETIYVGLQEIGKGAEFMANCLDAKGIHTFQDLDRIVPKNLPEIVSEEEQMLVLRRRHQESILQDGEDEYSKKYLEIAQLWNKESFVSPLIRILLHPNPSGMSNRIEVYSTNRLGIYFPSTCLLGRDENLDLWIHAIPLEPIDLVSARSMINKLRGCQ